MYGLVVAGGSGTRLWPLSRSNMPKQLLDLSGSGHSMLQSTLLRLSRTIPAENIHIVTGAAHARQVALQAREVLPGYPEVNVLAEPVGKDSAPAVLWGALRMYHLDPEARLAVIWSDQVIGREKAFDQALARAAEAVMDGGMAAVGVRPDHPATNLGYISYDAEMAPGVYRVEVFIEKPPLDQAKKLLAGGRAVWNAGIFMFKARTLIEEFQTFAPGAIGVFEAHDSTLRANSWLDEDLMARIYEGLPRESLDYLVLEKTDHLMVIPADLDWSDLGTWDEIQRRRPRDNAGNAVSGDVVLKGTENCLIQGGKRIIAAVGLENTVIIDTDDALLVARMDRAQEVKQVVEQMRSAGRPEVERPDQSTRPWGSYQVIAQGNGFKVKILEILPGKKLSLQMHHRRAEHWVVVEGEVHLTLEDEVTLCRPNDHFYIPKGARHRIDNRSGAPARMVEVQHGDYLGEDDIVRFEDDFGRA